MAGQVVVDPIQAGGDGGGLAGAGGAGDEDESVAALHPGFQQIRRQPELGERGDLGADRPHDGGETAQRVIEIHAEAAAMGELPGNVSLRVGGGIDAAGCPELFHRLPRDRAGVEEHHIALTPDARRFVLDEEHIGGGIREGIPDELGEGVDHRHPLAGHAESSDSAVREKRKGGRADFPPGGFRATVNGRMYGNEVQTGNQ